VKPRNILDSAGLSTFAHSPGVEWSGWSPGASSALSDLIRQPAPAVLTLREMECIRRAVCHGTCAGTLNSIIYTQRQYRKADASRAEFAATGDTFAEKCVGYSEHQAECFLIQTAAWLSHLGKCGVTYAVGDVVRAALWCEAQGLIPIVATRDPRWKQSVEQTEQAAKRDGEHVKTARDAEKEKTLDEIKKLVTDRGMLSDARLVADKLARFATVIRGLR
jgi:hypothetical protein